jgi:serine/threonine-protein kinase
MNRYEWNSLSPGDVIGGRYRIVGPLGEGGMSTVYLANDLKLVGKRWAVKRSRSMYGEYESAFNEASVLMKLDHPYLPHVVDYFPPDENGYAHIVMEYIEGETLERLFQRNGKTISERALIRYGIELCDLLDYLHAHDAGPFVYRDIKPANIMIDAQNHVRLIDFGIARKSKPGKAADTLPLGTVGFAAPELLEEGASDLRSDLYSLGATFYYLLTGGNYYSVTNIKLSDCQGAASKRLAELTDRMLDREPTLRPQSAADVRRQLESCLSETEGGKKRSAATLRREARPLRAARRLRIMAGGLYPGAGATFVALAMAKALEEAGVPHAVAEHPMIEPALFDLLDGERNDPAFDRSSGLSEASENRHFGRSFAHETAWRDGLTEWHPLPKNGAAHTDLNEFEKMLYRLDAPVVIVDVGAKWAEPEIARLCAEADLCVAAADPVPAKWSSRAAHSSVMQLLELEKAGINVRYAANKSVPFPGHKEWLSSFPSKPSAVIPYIPFDQMVRQSWKGRLIHDAPDVRKMLRDCLRPIIGDVIRELAPDSRRSSGFPWIGKIFSVRS